MAAGAIGTDHHLLRTKLKFHLKARKKKSKQHHVHLDQRKFKNEHLAKIFQAKFMNRPTASGSDNMTINQKPENFVDYVNKASNEVFTHDNSDKKRKE